jgi:hypothetical protein
VNTPNTESVAPHAHPLSEKWAPYRDPKTGEIVTLTPVQVAAVIHAVQVVDEVRRTQKRDPEALPHDRLYDDFPEKSRALGRLLIHGKALYEEIPPYGWGAAAYWEWDEPDA